MPRKILYIHPIFDPEMVEPLKDYLNTYRQKDTQIDVICFDRGVRRLDYAYYQALVGLDILNAVKKAEQDGYDAVIIGCFDDPLLREAKEICGRMAVVGLAEASMHLAMVLGDSFSILCVEEKDCSQFRGLVQRYGCGGHFVSFQVLGTTVSELQHSPEKTRQKVETCVRAAVRDQGAEVVVLGCSMMFGFFRSVQEDHGIPVIDPTLAGLKFAEYLCEVGEGPGWRVSRRGAFKAPPEEELRDWGLEWGGARA